MAGLTADITAGPITPFATRMVAGSVGRALVAASAAAVVTESPGDSQGVAMVASADFLLQRGQRYLGIQCCHTKYEAGSQSSCSLTSVPMSMRISPQTQVRSAS